MKEITPKRRKEIYLQAAINLDNRKGSEFCCDQIAELLTKATKVYTLHRGVTSSNFPEFYMFEPKSYTLEWWEYGEYDVRIIALLLAYNMIEND